MNFYAVNTGNIGLIGETWVAGERGSNFDLLTRLFYVRGRAQFGVLSDTPDAFLRVPNST
jgi:hypothetical protein